MKTRLMDLLVIAVASLSMPPSGYCRWQTFGPSSGFAGGTVTCMAEDRDGNLWFGTGGVRRYDGATWRKFTTADGLAHNSVNCILIDRSGVLWVGTQGGGVSRYDGANWRTFTTSDGLASDYVRSIIEDRNGVLWFGTEVGGVSRYDGVSWRTFTTADGLANNSVKSVLEDQSGALWFGTHGGGVSRYDGANWRTLTTADGLAGNWVNSILEDRSGALWFGTSGGGVSRYDGVTWRTFTAADGLASDFTDCLLEDRSGYIWVGTSDDGVSRYDGSAWRTYTTADGLGDDHVFSIFQDRYGNLWFGVRSNGVTRYDGESWRDYTLADGIADDVVNAIFEDRSGDVWLGTDHGVSRFDGDHWRTYTATEGAPEGGVDTILEDRFGAFWFCGWYVSRYDGSSWRTIDEAGRNVKVAFEDRSRNLWFGGFGFGVHHYDWTGWTWYTTDSGGLPSNYVVAGLADRRGYIWFGTQEDGVCRYDGRTWRTFTTADGLADNHVRVMLVDRSGNVWLGTSFGVSRYDGATWRTFTTADGLVGNQVRSMFVDHAGDIWVGTPGGASRYDGQGWKSYTSADGLAQNWVSTIFEDGAGNLWFGTHGGVSRYDGENWRSYGTADGLVSIYVEVIFEDRRGDLWFACAPDLHTATTGGLSRYEPDKVPPRTVFLNTPPAVLAARDLAVAFAAAFGETQGIEFSFRFDSEVWSPWSPTGSWTGLGVPDGKHVLEARCRDYACNTDPTPAIAVFEVDATPPAPVIAFPLFGQPVRGSTEIHGSTDDARFLSYRVEVRPRGAASWYPPEATVIVESATPVRDGTLAQWDTATLPDGDYELRALASDSLGLSASDEIRVVVDNHAPFADVTTPARVTATAGGDIYTTNSELHLYYPPHAFAEDAVVTIAPAPADSVPQTLPSGAVRVLPGYAISWSGAALAKPATLELSLAGVDLASLPGSPALYGLTDGPSWRRLGGTVDGGVNGGVNGGLNGGSGRISLAIAEPGRYALFADTGVLSGEATLTRLSFAPRVFSPTGGFADEEVGISFTLGRAAPATVRVYARSGRLIREVLVDSPMAAGANLVRWDGKDRSGDDVVDGIYLVTVEALGHTQTKPLAVVR